MMKGIKYISLIVALLYLTIGCKEILEYDEDSVNKVIVVSGILSPDKAVDIRLSRSINRFDTLGFVHLTDKTVAFFKGDKYMGDLTHLGRGRYYSDQFDISAGNKYSISISDGNHEEASGETYVPQPVPIIRLDTTYRFAQGERRIIVTVQFSEPLGIDNYYRLELVDEVFVPYIAANKDIRIRILRIPARVYSDNNWLLRGMGYYGASDKFHDWAGNQFNIFSDRYIEGEDMRLELEMDYFRTDSVLGVNRKIYLQSISKDYFYYLRTVMQQSQTASNPFNEPVQIYTNVKNGAGILGGYSFSVDSIVYINRALIDSLFPGAELPGSLNPGDYFPSAFIGDRDMKNL